MSAGTIVGYVTRPNGSPISGAEIWISQSSAFGGEAEEIKTAENDRLNGESVAKTDSRGYFQLTVACFGTDTAAVVGINGKLHILVGGRKGVQRDSNAASESCFQVKGYLIKENLKPDA